MPHLSYDVCDDLERVDAEEHLMSRALHYAKRFVATYLTELMDPVEGSDHRAHQCFRLKFQEYRDFLLPLY